MKTKENSDNKNTSKVADILIMILLILIPILIMYTIFTLAGPSWDLIVRYLNGKTLLNYLTHNISVQSAFVGEFTNNMLYYFEPYREPLSTPIFAILASIFQNPIFPYLMLVYFCFLFAIYKSAKEFGIDKLIAFSTFVNGYTIYFLFMVNGGEALSIIFVMFALFYLLRKSPLSGLFFGIASLAKYPALLLFPMLLLLGDRKKIIQALALDVFVVSLWGVFDYFVYGIPFYSIYASLANSGITGAVSTIYPIALAYVLAYPIVFGIIGIAYLMIKKKQIKIKLDYKSKVLIAFIIISGLTYFVSLPHNDLSTQERYGYMFSIALLFPTAIILTKASKINEYFRYFIAILAIAIMVYVLYSAYSIDNTFKTVYYNPGSNGSIYNFAGSALNIFGFGNCRFISNAWVPMIYSGYDVYSPFILYESGVISPISTKLSKNSSFNYSYQSAELQYPIIVFKYIGVQSSFVKNINHSTLVYQDQNMSIYLPQNATCYRN